MTTLATILYGNEAAARASLTSALDDRRLLQLKASGPGVASQAIEGILALLRMPVGKLALAAYQKHRRIESARRETLETHGSREVVVLLQHTIRSQQQPTIDAKINGITQTLVRLSLDAEISIEAMTVVIEGGRITETVPGLADASLVLRAGGIELARAETQPVDLGNPREAEVFLGP